MKRLRFSFAALLAPLPLLATPTHVAEPASAYLFAHFIDGSPQAEQIHFAVSEDGLTWTDLNDSRPVLVSDIGDKGVRDPSLIRLADGDKFILLATDLRIANGKGWGAATTRGSTSLVFWESADLVNWSEPWMVDVAGAIPGAGCAWAPEAIHDTATGDYFVYWATMAPHEGGPRKHRIYGARTKDFRTFSAPELYIERPDHGIIDTQILEVKGAKHRYYRVSCDGQITFEAADSLLGPWTRTGDLAYAGYTNKQLEGPILYPFEGQSKWGLLLDQYAARRGYLPFVTTDLDDAEGFGVVPSADHSLGASKKRHGGILGITRAELKALRARWPGRSLAGSTVPASPPP